MSVRHTLCDVPMCQYLLRLITLGKIYTFTQPHLKARLISLILTSLILFLVHLSINFTIVINSSQLWVLTNAPSRCFICYNYGISKKNDVQVAMVTQLHQYVNYSPTQHMDIFSHNHKCLFYII